MSDKIKALFPEGVETITISKNDYDRLYGELTYQNIQLQSNWNSLRECIKKEIKKLLDIMDKDKIEGFELTVFQNAINRYKYILDKMNELEGGEDEKN